MTRGAIKTLPEEVAARTQIILNIDRSTKRERIIAEKLMDRGRTDSAFEGDNHFRNLASPSKINKVKNVNETVDYEDNQSLRLGIRI